MAWWQQIGQGDKELSPRAKGSLKTTTISPDRLAQDVFVEGPCKVALQEAVVIYSFGYNASYKLEVAEVVGVTVGRWIDRVGDPVTR